MRKKYVLNKEKTVLMLNKACNERKNHGGKLDIARRLGCAPNTVTNMCYLHANVQVLEVLIEVAYGAGYTLDDVICVDEVE